MLRSRLLGRSRLLPSHVSPVFDIPARSLRDHSRQRLHWRSRPHVLAEPSRPKSAGHAPLRTCIAKFGYLARSDANTGYEPNEFDKNTFVDDDTTLINDPNHNFPTSRKPRTRTPANSVLTQCLNILFCTFLMMTLLFRKKAKKACNRETVGGQREREREREKKRKEKVLWSVLHNRCQGKVNGTVFVWVSRVSENSILMDEISEKRRVQQAIFSWKFRSAKILSDWVQHGDPAFRAKKFRIRELESQKQQLLEANQSKLNVREYICAANWGMEDHLHQECYVRSCREIGEYAEENYPHQKKKRRLEESPTQHDQESRTVSLFFCDPDPLSSYDVPTFLIKLLLPRVQESLAAKLECREIHEIIWVFLETFLIVNMLDEVLLN